LLPHHNRTATALWLVQLCSLGGMHVILI